MASGITPTFYALKPRFQGLLRPLAASLHRLAITPNLVTVAAALGSMAVGAGVAWRADSRRVFLIVSAWLLARMALNAIDGMLAREFDQKSVPGAYLNEIGDVVSDAALYAPFALIAPFEPFGIGLIIILSIVTELAGVLGQAVGASRRYDGPMGKSDRAVVFGILGLWIASSAPIPPWVLWAVPALAVLLAVTAVNRVRAGILEAARAGSSHR